MIFKNLKKRFYTSTFLIVLIILISQINYLLGLCLIIFSVLSILEFLNLINKIFKQRFFKVMSNFIFILFIFLFSYFFFIFSVFFNLKPYLFMILIICIASDIGGYIVGNYIKGPKLTKISPNKTISGAIGSLISSIIVFLIFSKFILTPFNYNVLLIALSTSIACQLGDLFFSFMKRKAKIKDTGNLLPGHGGVLDRLDGIFVGLPVGFITLLSSL